MRVRVSVWWELLRERWPCLIGRHRMVAVGGRRVCWRGCGKGA